MNYRLSAPAIAALAIVAVALSSPRALAQVRCEPTIAQPCKPPAGPAAAPGKSTEKAREPARLPETPPLPEIKIDNDTSAGFGKGGVFGLERKF
jgi:hypothetical protein